MQSAHFKDAIAMLPRYLGETPRIVSQTVDQDDWSEWFGLNIFLATASATSTAPTSSNTV